MGRSLGRLYMKLSSICLQKQKNRWKETQQGSKISFICTIPSSWLQPALCMSATIEPSLSILLQAFPSPSITLWLLIYREPGTQSWVYFPSSLPHAHTHNTHVDAYTLCLLLQLWIVESPRNLYTLLPKSELIRAKEKSGPEYVLGSSSFQPLSI